MALKAAHPRRAAHPAPRCSKHNLKQTTHGVWRYLNDATLGPEFPHFHSGRRWGSIHTPQPVATFSIIGDNAALAKFRFVERPTDYVAFGERFERRHYL